MKIEKAIKDLQDLQEGLGKDAVIAMDIWTVEEIQSHDERLTQEEAVKTIEIMERDFDAGEGYGFDALDCAIEEALKEG